MNRMKTLVSLAIGMIVVFAAATAWAGARWDSPVHVENYSPPSGGYAGLAYGALGSARNSADTKQYIGCELSALSTDAVVSVTCVGRSGTPGFGPS